MGSELQTMFPLSSQKKKNPEKKIEKKASAYELWVGYTYYLYKIHKSIMAGFQLSGV